MPVELTPYDMREGSHTDPDGNLIRFGSPAEEELRGRSGDEPVAARDMEHADGMGNETLRLPKVIWGYRVGPHRWDAIAV